MFCHVFCIHFSLPSNTPLVIRKTIIDRPIHSTLNRHKGSTSQSPHRDQIYSSFGSVNRIGQTSNIDLRNPRKKSSGVKSPLTILSTVDEPPRKPPRSNKHKKSSGMSELCMRSVSPPQSEISLKRKSRGDIDRISQAISCSSRSNMDGISRK